MTKGVTLALSSDALIGLFFLYRYRFLTIAQFAKASGLSSYRSQDLLLMLERRGLLGNFGGVPIPGHGKTPKAYYLTRRGFEMLRREGDIPEELLGSFVEAVRESS